MQINVTIGTSQTSGLRTKQKNFIDFLSGFNLLNQIIFYRISQHVLPGIKKLSESKSTKGSVPDA